MQNIKFFLRLSLRCSLCIVIAYGLYLNLFSAFSQQFQAWLLLFYTTISNSLVLLVFLWLCVYDFRLLLSSAKPQTTPYSLIFRIKVMLTWAISITGIVWHILLVPRMTPELLATAPAYVDLPALLMSFSLLHTWSPLLVFLDWLFFDSKNRIERFAPIRWLCIPLAYFVFICIWVNTVGPVNADYGFTYPYPFLDFQANGNAKTWCGIMVILLGMLSLGYFYLVIDRLIPRLNRVIGLAINKH